jgi:peptidoglycan-N-acetylglucosamine deacetylase
MIRNIMTVDLEDYYCDKPFASWNEYENRIVQNTRVILDLFEKYHVTATFFTLGYIAQRHSDLIEEVRSKGHEIASHGYSHANIRTLNKESFEADLVKSLDVLRKVSGEKILGFRAPFFSINKHNFWAFDIIKKYLRYDSSIFPANLHYHLPEAPRHIYNMSDQDPLKEDPGSKFIEIPLTTLRLSYLGNFPIAGAFYMRFLPFRLVKFSIYKFNKEGFPAVFYIHPSDLDPKVPHLDGYTWHYYWGLKSAPRKFESLMKSFKFSAVRDVVEF